MPLLAPFFYSPKRADDEKLPEIYQGGSWLAALAFLIP